MIILEYAPAFLRQLKKLPPELQHEAKKKITLFKSRSSHQRLRVHKLKGGMEGKWSFSVDYQNRIVFEWLPDGAAALLAIGDHSIYD